MPDVTVVIPSYNHAPFIGRTLRSVFKQSYAPKKLIVIDDGSKDESVKIVDRALSDAPFDAELIARGNRGLCATLNEGFSKCETEYFAYIGSDDVWLNGFLGSRMGVLTLRPDAVAAFGHSYLIDEEDNIIDCTKEWGEYPDISLLPMLLKLMAPASASFVYRSNAIEKVPWNEDSFLEDFEHYLRLSSVGDFALDPSILCAWREHGWNVSRNYRRMFEEALEALTRIAPTLGISNEDLSRYQSAIKFNSAFDFIRHDDRKKAISMVWENRKGMESFTQVARILLRLVTPRKIFKRNRIRMRKRNIAKYGKIIV